MNIRCGVRPRRITLAGPPVSSESHGLLRMGEPPRFGLLSHLRKVVLPINRQRLADRLMIFRVIALVFGFVLRLVLRVVALVPGSIVERPAFNTAFLECVALSNVPALTGLACKISA